MSGWDELVSAALLGTDRRQPSLDGLPPAVRELLDGASENDLAEGPLARDNFSSPDDEKLHRTTGPHVGTTGGTTGGTTAGSTSDGAAGSDAGPGADGGGVAVRRDDPARMLLDAAALSTAYRRAGRRALGGVEPLPRASTEDRPVPGEGATRRLAAMLSGEHSAVLAEWLRVVRERGWAVPPELLPALADLARGRTELRQAVAAAAGPRGGWLAGLNPDWAFLADDVPDEDDWLHGAQTKRRRWLVAKRSTDPAAAREALESTWPKEPASSKAELLKLLEDGLSLQDEEFLERALDDRAAEVRRVAATVLAGLPGSRYGERMAQRVLACLAVRKRPLRRGVLEVTLPEECDEGMRRDGIDPRPPRGETAVGERAWWLAQLIQAAPLHALTEGLGKSPAELLGLEVEGYDPDLLHAALANATVREQDAGWALAVLRVAPAAGHRTAELLAVLPAQEWAAAVAGVRDTVDPADIVGRLPQPWPANLGTMLLDVLQAATPDRSWARLASVTGRSVPPETLAHPLVDEPVDEEDTWRRRLVETLVFRREMYGELGQGAWT